MHIRQRKGQKKLCPHIPGMAKLLLTLWIAGGDRTMPHEQPPLKLETNTNKALLAIKPRQHPKGIKQGVKLFCSTCQSGM